MRKVILFALLLSSTIAVKAQCTSCNTQQQTTTVVFDKHIFTPPPIGGETSGELAYIDEPPTLNGGFGGVSMTAYVWMINANGQPVKRAMSGQIDSQNVPDDWNGTFFGPTNRPRVYPMAIPIKVWALPYLNPDGSPKRDERTGLIVSYQIIKFFAKDYNIPSVPKVINF